jgi:hypothetical protein
MIAGWCGPGGPILVEPNRRVFDPTDDELIFRVKLSMRTSTVARKFGDRDVRWTSGRIGSLSYAVAARGAGKFLRV